MNAERASQFRARAASLLAGGASPAAIARELGYARRTVYNARAQAAASELSLDRRLNPGWPRLFGDIVERAVIQGRGDVMPVGPRMLHHLML